MKTLQYSDASASRKEDQRSVLKSWSMHRKPNGNSMNAKTKPPVSNHSVVCVTRKLVSASTASKSTSSIVHDSTMARTMAAMQQYKLNFCEHFRRDMVSMHMSTSKAFSHLAANTRIQLIG